MRRLQQVTIQPAGFRAESRRPVIRISAARARRSFFTSSRLESSVYQSLIMIRLDLSRAPLLAPRPSIMHHSSLSVLYTPLLYTCAKQNPRSQKHQVKDMIKYSVEAQDTSSGRGAPVQLGEPRTACERKRKERHLWRAKVRRIQQ